MMATLVSHVGQAFLTVNYDPAAVRDVGLFERCLRESFAELELLAEDSEHAGDAAAPPGSVANDRTK